jgi:hypothetical protein
MSCATSYRAAIMLISAAAGGAQAGVRGAVGGAGSSFTFLNPQPEIYLMKRSLDHRSGGMNHVLSVEVST